MKTKWNKKKFISGNFLNYFRTCNKHDGQSPLTHTTLFYTPSAKYNYWKLQETQRLKKKSLSSLLCTAQITVLNKYDGIQKYCGTSSCFTAPSALSHLFPNQNNWFFLSLVVSYISWWHLRRNVQNIWKWIKYFDTYLYWYICSKYLNCWLRIRKIFSKNSQVNVMICVSTKVRMELR